MLLQLDEIYIKQNSEKLISQIEINVDSYGIYLISGKNGCGKTTVAKLLFEKYTPFTSMMLQENDLIFKEISMIENIEMFQHKNEEINNFLKLHNLDYLLEKDPRFLSGGEKRIISLLRVLLSDKKILILDEPSNDIDYFMFEKIKELILYFSKKKSILLISHDDRFDVFIKKYTISNKEFYLLEENEKAVYHLEKAENMCRNEVKNEEIKMHPFKLGKYNFLFFFSFFLSLGILLYSLWNDLKLSEPESYVKYNPGIFHIGSLISTNLNEFNDNDSFNTALLKAALKKNKFEYINSLKNNKNKIDIAIEIKKSTVEEIYPMQYYCIENRSYTNVTDQMKEIILSSIAEENMIIEFQTSLKDYLNLNKITQSIARIPVSMKDTEIITYLKSFNYEIIYEDYSDNEIFLDFNIQLYMEALPLILKQENILVEVIVVLKDNMNYVDFVLANNLEKQAVLIQGYEIYLLNIEINNFNTWYILIRSLMLYFLLILGLFWVILNIYESSNMKKYRLLHYYGYSTSEVCQYRNLYYMIKPYNYLTYIMYVLIGVWIYLHFKSYMILFIFIISVFLYSLSIHTLRSLITRKIRRSLNESRKFQNKKRKL